MTKSAERRKLAAIVSADVQGYSRLMGDDENATVETITAYRAVFDKVVQRYGGRIVNAPGDSVLAEFPSVVDAVSGAVDTQAHLAAENAKLPKSRQMIFRIGVNLGDMIEKEGDIYGDGVNIAARVESLAEGGGICISGPVFDQVRKKPDYGFA